MAMRRVARSSSSSTAAVAAATASPSPSLLFAARPPTASCRRFHSHRVPTTKDPALRSFTDKMAALGAKMGIGGGAGGSSSAGAAQSPRAALGTGSAQGQTALARAAAALLGAFDFEDTGGEQLSIDREMEAVLRLLGVHGIADTVRREQVPGRGFGGGFALSQSSLQVLKASGAVESLQAIVSGGDGEEDATEHVRSFLLVVAQTCASADPLVSLMCANRALESILGLDEEPAAAAAAAAAAQEVEEGEGEKEAAAVPAAAAAAPSVLHDVSVVEALPLLTVKTAAYNQLRMHGVAERLGSAVLAGFAREAEEKAAQAAAESSVGGGGGGGGGGDAVVPSSSGDAKQGFLSSLMSVGGGGGGGGGGAREMAAGGRKRRSARKQYEACGVVDAAVQVSYARLVEGRHAEAATALALTKGVSGVPMRLRDALTQMTVAARDGLAASRLAFDELEDGSTLYVSFRELHLHVPELQSMAVHAAPSEVLPLVVAALAKLVAPQPPQKQAEEEEATEETKAEDGDVGVVVREEPVPRKRLPNVSAVVLFVEGSYAGGVAGTEGVKVVASNTAHREVFVVTHNCIFLSVKTHVTEEGGGGGASKEEELLSNRRSTIE